MDHSRLRVSLFYLRRVGLTQDVAFMTMEEKATTQVGAAQANNAEVDLSTWALPGEIIEQACTRDVLWHFLV